VKNWPVKYKSEVEYFNSDTATHCCLCNNSATIIFNYDHHCSKKNHFYALRNETNNKLSHYSSTQWSSDRGGRGGRPEWHLSKGWHSEVSKNWFIIQCSKIGTKNTTNYSRLFFSLSQL